MKCFFLSADRQLRSWTLIQESFGKYAPPHWSVELFMPTSGQDVARAWHSLLAGAGQESNPFMLVSEGLRLGPQSAETIENSIQHLEKSGGFDLLLPDIRLMQAGAMADLFVLRRQLVTQGRTRLIDPRTLGFENPGACIVHPRAVARLARPAKVHTVAELIDGALCQPVRDGGMSGRFIFPFATMVSHGEDGQVPADSQARAAMIGDIYRRMVWRDGGCEPELAPLAQMSKGLSTEAKAFAILWAAMAD